MAILVKGGLTVRITCWRAESRGEASRAHVFGRSRMAWPLRRSENPPPRKSTIYQTTAPGSLTPLPYNFVLWDRDGRPMLDVAIYQREQSSNEYLLVQGKRVVGHIWIDAPEGATGQQLYPAGPSFADIAPVTGVPTACLKIAFRVGSAPGDCTVTFDLNGGNGAQMFVRVTE